jgi:RNA polymerase sigma-70 factor (ECF subfamily)
MQLKGQDTVVFKDKDGIVTFEEVFRAHFKGLHAYAFTMVKDDMAAEEIIQGIFCRLWEKTGRLEVEQSITAYLYRAVYNESLNYLKHLKVRAAYQSYKQHTMHHRDDSSSAKVLLHDLEEKLGAALQELPEGCRTIFQMSRFEELKYQEIANRLNISVKTVENQMGKALRLLRLKLADFLPALLIACLLSNL